MADTIQPVHAGAGNVYSAEYFTLVRSALREGGLAVQWVSGTEAEYKMIMRTFLSVFPHATLWADAGVMVGSMTPLRLEKPTWNGSSRCRRPGRRWKPSGSSRSRT